MVACITETLGPLEETLQPLKQGAVYAPPGERKDINTGEQQKCSYCAVPGEAGPRRRGSLNTSNVYVARTSDLQGREGPLY